jgi:putative two-component system response regulator
MDFKASSNQVLQADRIFDAPILVVDDQADNIQLFEDILRGAGYRRVVSTTDPRQVLRLYDLHRPVLILLDLNMPHLDGFQLMNLLREKDPEGFPPVLVLTGTLDRAVKLKALSQGARDFLAKPFDLVEIRYRVKNLLEIGVLSRELKDQNGLLEENVRERTGELEASRVDLVLRLANACDRRDGDTGAHIMRMSRHAGNLAKALGLGDSECDLIHLASPLHDIGKIAIPDNILRKPGPLTDEEWVIMKTHAAVGAEMLASGASALIEAGRIIALTHHERWDGSGYPGGLFGEAIPLYGRICALADAFDAMTSDRVYHRGMTIEKANETIHAASGKHFDPVLVRLYERSFADLTGDPVSA